MSFAPCTLKWTQVETFSRKSGGRPSQAHARKAIRVTPKLSDFLSQEGFLCSDVGSFCHSSDRKALLQFDGGPSCDLSPTRDAGNELPPAAGSPGWPQVQRAYLKMRLLRELVRRLTRAWRFCSERLFRCCAPDMGSASREKSVYGSLFNSIIVIVLRSIILTM